MGHFFWGKGNNRAISFCLVRLRRLSPDFCTLQCWLQGRRNYVALAGFVWSAQDDFRVCPHSRCQVLSNDKTVIFRCLTFKLSRLQLVKKDISEQVLLCILFFPLPRLLFHCILTPWRWWCEFPKLEYYASLQKMEIAYTCKVAVLFNNLSIDRFYPQATQRAFHSRAELVTG